MKKLFTLAIAALALIATGCNPEGSDEGEGNATASDLIGKWSITLEMGTIESEFKADGTVTFNEQDDARWSIDNGILTITSGDDAIACKVQTLYEKSALVLRYDIPATDKDGHYLGTMNGEGECMLLYRNGKAKASDIQDIQGKWHWLMQRDEEYVRGAITISGNDFELIITPWAERYTGTCSYSNGYLNFHPTKWYTARNPEGSGDDTYGEGTLNPATLEATWYDYEYYYDNGEKVKTAYIGALSIHEDPEDYDFTFPFLANNTEAYGYMANLSAVYQKK